VEILAARRGYTAFAEDKPGADIDFVDSRAEDRLAGDTDSVDSQAEDNRYTDWETAYKTPSLANIDRFLLL
jgi:hypothetical protein